MTDTLLLAPSLWLDTWDGLRRRCAGHQEAACVWGGRRDGSIFRCTSVVFLNDLPGVRSARLYHVTPPAATAMLFEILRQRDECIAADIHAHPEEWVGQSQTDAEHPIEYRVGLLALILPHFAQSAPDLAAVGVHEYLGQLQWRTLPTAEAHFRIVIQG